MPKAPKRIYNPELPFSVSIVTRDRRPGSVPVRHSAFDTLENATSYVATYVPVEYEAPFTAWCVTHCVDGIVRTVDRGDNSALISCRH